MLISGGNLTSALHSLLPRYPSEIINLQMPVRTLGPLEEDNTNMQTSYVDFLDVAVYLAH